MEEKVHFSSGNLKLEGLLKRVSGPKGALLAHPHPLYGGDMINPVVESLASTYNRKGYTTLRFNFRGVGASQGRYDEGDGEQEDILAAAHFLLDQGVTSLHIAGYSFGSWVLARIKKLPPEVASLVFVSPPLAMMPFAQTLKLPLLHLVITGEEDEIAPADRVRASLHHWNPDARMEVIDFADHFYFGCFRELEKAVHDFL